MQSLAGEKLKTSAALLFYPQFWLAVSVSSLLFLLEQNKEVHVLFSSCEMECLLSVDCIQFTEGKLQATCEEGHTFHLSFSKMRKKPAAHSQLTIQGSMDEHKINKQKIISLLPTELDHNMSL